MLMSISIINCVLEEFDLFSVDVDTDEKFCDSKFQESLI